ncbi:DUF4390 domain-containing protein [Granulosicoccus sp. 3-233]|uniref:DUF4390 domain-containing protein n=1 Tax=Granulosicoccus sp. 3-233 TaxID=3417969 RepID=UPI003D33C414
MATDPEKRRWALAVLLVPSATLLVFILVVSISTRGLSPRGLATGSIQLEDVSLRQAESGQWYLSADAEINLPEPIKAGLDSGVPLDFILDLEFRHLRHYWLDQSLASYRHHYRLTYYELTRHYRVHAVETDDSRNFRSLNAALTGLGEFDRLPVVTDPADEQAFAVSDALAKEGAIVLAALDFRLDSKSLPLPLQPLIASSWRLASEEYQWQVN